VSPVLRRVLAALAITVATTALAGCRPSRPVAQIVVELRDPDPVKRQHAASDLQTKNGVHVQAIPHLLQAASVEQNKEALGAMLVTLGKSGVPEAKGLIDQHIPTTDLGLRKHLGRALRYWYIANSQIAPDAKPPEHWPYGQEGYPPLLPGQN
jgi:hypothetical protein